MDFNAWLVDVTGEIDGFMYTYILLILLVAVGVYFTIRTKGVQIRFIKDMFKQLTEKKHVQGERSISSFQALMVSTASRVGTGNIAGVATAIAAGGPGAVFWMWLMALVGAASAFVESTLAQIWKVRGTDGEFRGGPAYYIHQALGSRKLGVLFSVLLILCFAFGFNGLQAFNACSALEYYIPDYATNGVAVAAGLGLVVFTAGVIFGGSKRISVITSIIVPVMAIAYIAIALWTTIANITWLPAVFGLMFQSAFDFQSIFGGFAGSVVMLGIKRGLYSNEAGMGSAPNAAAHVREALAFGQLHGVRVGGRPAEVVRRKVERVLGRETGLRHRVDVFEPVGRRAQLVASLLEAVWRVGQQLRLERCAHGLGYAVLRAQRRLKRASVIGAGEAPDHARRAGALLEQALDAARFARDTRLHIARREVRQVHVMRRLVVLALLRRDVAAEVKRGVEAGRLDACRAHVLLAVGQQLRVQRARAPLVCSKVDAADAAPARQLAQRERAPEHGHVADRALVQVVDRKVGPVGAEAVAGKDDGMV